MKSSLVASSFILKSLFIFKSSELILTWQQSQPSLIKQGGVKHLVPVHEAGPINPQVAPSWRPCSHSWFLTPRLQRRAAGKQEPHVSTERTQPGGHSEPYHGTPSIIDEVKRDELLLRAHKEHTPPPETCLLSLCSEMLQLTSSSS